MKSVTVYTNQSEAPNAPRIVKSTESLPYQHRFEMRIIGCRTWFYGIIPDNIRPFRKQAKFLAKIQYKWTKRFRSESLLNDILRLKALLKEIQQLAQRAQLEETKQSVNYLVFQAKQKLSNAIEAAKKQSAYESALMRKMASERWLP